MKPPLLLFFGVVLFKGSAVNSNWIRTSHGEYKVDNLNLAGYCTSTSGCSYDQSKIICEKEGGFLAEISSQQENDEINNILRPYIGKHWFHIGLTDTQAESF